MDRRNFLSLSAGTLAAPLAIGTQSVWGSTSLQDPGPRKKIAFLGTEVRQHSHAQHFLDRHAMGYIWNGQWQKPRFDIASVFIDQFPEQDLGKQRIEKYKLKQYPTIAEALTLGGSKLAVDGVVIIAEHGNYPKNEKGNYAILATIGSNKSSRSSRPPGKVSQCSMTSTCRPFGRVRGDGRGFASTWLCFPGRIIAASHLATTFNRYAVRCSLGRKLLRLLWRSR